AQFANRIEMASHCQWSVVSGQWSIVGGPLSVVRSFFATDHGQRTTDYTRRFFGGRQPLCGSGVTSSMALTFRPAACSAVTADSRPEPGPFTRTSICLTPNFAAFSAQISAARWAANGVLLRLP